MSGIYNLPLDSELVLSEMRNLHIRSLSSASIREIVRLSLNLEKKYGIEFVHMEMGIPGLPPNPQGVIAQIKALQNGVASIYPHIEGIPELKDEIAKFAKLFLDIDVNPSNCFPTVGAMQATFASFMTVGRLKPNSKTLFIDPGFPVQKQQHKVLGLDFKGIDIYQYRGQKLETQLTQILSQDNFNSIVYSSPNNPAWIVLTEDELKIIGNLCEKFDLIVIEDLAYFAMDFRHDYSVPGTPPYPPTIAKYTENYIIIISSSKIFSYAGERIAAMIVSDALANREFPELLKFFGTEKFSHALVYGALYSLSSGTSHSAQFALNAMLKGANDGYPFLEPLKEYARRAKRVKEIFLKRGYKIVYSMDDNNKIADGFYFTLTYPDINTEKLLFELMRYGVSAISLHITGSNEDGIRVCVSQLNDEKIELLESRINSLNFKNQ